ncbi:MAG: hypothetical protein R3300_15130 [Candidatus Promineifilaceae bacterium]|nr:hypothetical protein [Candidatus Promineifilaceae bacterium]
MTSPSTPVQVLCRQCSAPLPVEQGRNLVTCEFCGTTNAVDKGQTVFHYVVRTTVRDNEAEAALRRWMAGNDTVKNLDSKATVSRPRFLHFPMWLVRAQRNGREEVYLQPAAATSISELKQLTIPAADLESYDHALDDSAEEANVPYETMRRRLNEEQGLTPADIREVSLVHLPLYEFKYEYDGERYTAVVDGATGRVLANLFPSKWEVPYLAIGAAAFAAYFCAALAPLVGFLSGGGGGLGLGVLIYFGLAIVFAIPIFIAAAAVSAKV